MNNQNNQTKFQWKRLISTPIYQILFDKEYKTFLQSILSHQITEFEVDNLPSFHIISFIQVLQNYIYYYIQNNNPILNSKMNKLEEIISSKNEKIEKLKEKIIDCEKIIVEKGGALNEANQKLFLLYEQYCKLKDDYKIKINMYKEQIKEKEENYKEIDDKLIDTFDYLSNLVLISKNNIKVNINENKTENKKQKNKKINQLNPSNTFNKDNNKKKEDGVNKQIPTRSNRKAKTEGYKKDKNSNTNKDNK